MSAPATCTFFSNRDKSLKKDSDEKPEVLCKNFNKKLYMNCCDVYVDQNKRRGFTICEGCSTRRKKKYVQIR